MRFRTALLIFVACAAAPLWADKRLDDAVKKAEAQLAKGNENEAVKILQKAASQAPRDPEPPLALATLLTRLGRLDEAATALGKAGELCGSAPAGVRARVRASQSGFALRVGTAGEALAFAKQAVEAAPGPESLAALARAQARLGLGAARETAEQAARGAPAAAAQLARGDALLAARLGAEAEAAYRRALQLSPGSAAAGTGLALALSAQRRAVPALEAARAAMQADPHAGEAQAAVGLAALAQDPEDKKSEAIVAAQQAGFLEPKNPLVKLTLGRVFESRGQLDQAAAAYAEAAALDPTWPAPRIAALGVRMQQGDATGALDAFRALPVELQTSGEAQLLLGRLLSQREEWSAALAALERAAAALPGLAEAAALRGTAAYNCGELKLAADAYGRAVELDPENLAYRTSRALYLGYDGRREEAVSVLLDLTARPEGQTPEAFMTLGAIYRDVEPPRVAEAVAAYEQALKLDPRNGQAALGVAQSYRAGRQWARAITAYERVSQGFKRLDGEALLGTAWCYYLSGDSDRARFYTGLAVRAGADVGGIREALSRPAGATSTTLELDDLSDALRSRNAGVQARAVKQLVELGRPAVATLAAALARKGTSIAARELIVDGLGSLGPAAREALPQLERVAKAVPPVPGPEASAEDRALREREARLAASAQAASDRIRGR